MRRPWAEALLTLPGPTFRRVAAGLMIERVRLGGHDDSSNDGNRLGPETEPPILLSGPSRRATTLPPSADHPPALPPSFPAGLGLSEIIERVAGVLGLPCRAPCAWVAASSRRRRSRCSAGTPRVLRSCAIPSTNHGGTVAGSRPRSSARSAVARVGRPAQLPCARTTADPVGPHALANSRPWSPDPTTTTARSRARRTFSRMRGKQRRLERVLQHYRSGTRSSPRSAPSLALVLVAHQPVRGRLTPTRRALGHGGASFSTRRRRRCRDSPTHVDER